MSRLVSRFGALCFEAVSFRASISPFLAAALFLVAPIATAAQADARDNIGDLCAQMGLAPGNLDFTYCVLSLRQSANRVGYSESTGEGQAHDYRSGDVRHRYRLANSDFYGSDQRAREERACAGLGLPRGSYALGQCVANLQATMSYVQNQGLIGR